MNIEQSKKASPAMVIVAFATVYIVWGSTYFFIQKAVAEFPPFIMGAMRFLIAGSILLLWCIIKGEKVWNPTLIKHAATSGLLLLLIGNGAVIWAEQTLPSSLVAVLVSSVPIWFVLLDRAHWTENFKSRETLTGLFIGFAGVILLFVQRISESMSSANAGAQVLGLLILIVGSMSWAAGSLYSKAKSSSYPATVNTAWQMFAAGIAFLPFAFLSGETKSFSFSTVTPGAWVSISYLIVFGSLIAYSAYVWLLQVRSATQVSTYGYVNPVVAVLLGVFFNNEPMSWIQILGLAIILTSVLLINVAKARKERKRVAVRRVEMAVE
jgi:drug/metabolite transporter (DMT)-like permease